MSSPKIEQIISVKRLNEKRWLSIDGVVAVGIGTTPSGQEGLIVSVKEDAARIRELIPWQIENVEIEIRETGELTAL